LEFGQSLSETLIINAEPLPQLHTGEGAWHRLQESEKPVGKRGWERFRRRRVETRCIEDVEVGIGSVRERFQP
jgi:hypothetical protein